MRPFVAALKGLTRAGRDRATAAEKLPPTAREVVVEGLRGWLYSIRSTVGDEFELFLWFDGSAYQVRVVSPDVWARPELLHSCHVFHDARICFGRWEGGGMPTLEGAYAGSVAWANGYSTWRRTGRFTV